MRATKEKFIVDTKGHKTAVVLDMDSYENLLEDLEDLRVIAERKDEPSVPIEKVRKMFKQNGLI